MFLKNKMLLGKDLFVKHYAAIIAAFFVGFLMVLPQIIFVQSLGKNYKGLYMMNADAETHYLARMNKACAGEGMGNPYYFENKNDVPNVFYEIAESAAALPCNILGIGVTNLNLIYKFIFPAAIFLLIYAFLYRLKLGWLWSLSGACLILLGNSLVSIEDISNLIGFKEVYSQFALYSRPINPELTGLVFFVYLHLLYSFFHMDTDRPPYEAKRRGKQWAICATMTAVFGLSFYLYFYLWTFILALNFCVVVTCFLTKNLRTKALFAALVTFLGMAAGFRSIYELYLIKTHPWLKLISGEYLLPSHEPIVSVAGVIVTVLFGVYLYQKTYLNKKTIKSELEPDQIFLIAALASTWIVVNQQVLTGISMQAGHYHWYFNTPIFLIILMFLIANFIEILFKSKKQIMVAKRIAATFLILISLWSAAWIQYSSYRQGYEHAVALQAYGNVFDWLNQNTVPDDVVVVNKELSELLPVFTKLETFEAGYGKYYLLSPLRRDFGNEQALKALKMGEVLPFRLDHIVWRESTEPEWKLDAISGLRKRVDFGDISIYSIANEPSPYPSI